MLKSSPKYEEELKSLKKEINPVKLSKDELGLALSKTQENFSEEEIYQYSRADSVKYKILFNFNFFNLDRQQRI